MDYKDLIEQLKNIRFIYADNMIKCESICNKAADAIETLLAERDAAIEMLKGECNACKHNTGWHNIGKCAVCVHETAREWPVTKKRTDCWEWCGPQKD